MPSERVAEAWFLAIQEAGAVGRRGGSAWTGNWTESKELDGLFGRVLNVRFNREPRGAAG